MSIREEIADAGSAALAPPCLPPQVNTSAPSRRLPRGATDCHCHVFEDPQRYPLVDQRSYTPQPASRDAYWHVCTTLGVERMVQVSASVYGADNRLTLAVIAAWGQHRARGVAGLAPDVTHEELVRLHAGGMRGVRLSTAVRGYGTPDGMTELAARIRSLGWHLQLHFREADEIALLEPSLMALDVPLVFDHMGSAKGLGGVGQPGFQALLRILRQRDDAWVKVSSWYRRSALPFPHDDMQTLAQALAAARPDGLLFGTNWPHPALATPQQMPDDGKLVDTFFDWFPDATLRQQVLVDNPALLYGFDALPD